MAPRKTTQTAAAPAAATESLGPTDTPTSGVAASAAGAAAEANDPAAGDAARESAASNDASAVAEVASAIAAPAEGAAAPTSEDLLRPGEGVELLFGGTLADETLLGSSILPALVDLGHGQEIQLGVIVRGAFKASGLDVEAWNAVTEDVREKLLALMVELTARSVALKVEYERLLAPPPEGLVEFIGRSADGKPFRRRGIDWTDTFVTHRVTPEVAERLAADPNISQPA